MENNSPVSRRGKSGAGHQSEPPSIPKRRRTSSAAGQSSTPSSRQGGEGREVIKLDDEDAAAAAAADNEHPGDGLLSVVLSELLLECYICNHPLSIPVFQCVNGHILCSSCCKRVNQKCPTCMRKIGKIRCLAIENVLEAIKVSCSYKNYGCPEQISYSSKNSHDLTCAYIPCGCPFTGCTFVGSRRSLSPHMNTNHVNFVVRLRFNQVCKFTMSLAEEFVVLREEGEGKLFFLNKHDRMSISCFDDETSGSGGDRFAYALVVRGKDSSNRFQSLTNRFENTGKGGGVGYSSTDFIQVPSYMGDHDGCLRLELCIWSKGSPSIDIAGDINGQAHQT